MEESSNQKKPTDVDPNCDIDGSNVSYILEEPTVGMIFDSVKEVKSFYKSYACTKGFQWKIRNLKTGADGQLCYLVLACTRAGSRAPKISSTIKTLPTSGAQCDAKITVSRGESEVWYIKKVVLDHSHDVSPSKSRFFKMNKSISLHVERTIQVNDDTEVRINKIFQSLARAVGGYDNLSFGERDLRNYIVKERRAIRKEGDAKALLSHFRTMKEHNCNFVYDIDLDDKFHVRHVFWADARSRTTYEAFGDVVTFDTTYLTNKYDMSFAAFVGINHHGQTCLLGCGLLSSEDSESFVWLFKCCVRCMSGKAPSDIVSDQCRAIQKAIEKVMLTTRHRWCLWHIMKKIPEKLRTYEKYRKIKSAFKAAIYETIKEEEFEYKWCSLLNEFELEENE